MKLRAQTKAQFATLQAKWYRKLKDTGFEDIEGGRDLNKFSTSSFRGKAEEDKGLEFVSTSSTSGGRPFDATELFLADNREVYGAATCVADTPQALLWRQIGQAIHALPGNAKHRAFLVTWSATGKQSESARRHNFTRGKARWIVDTFCAAHGFDKRRLFSTAKGDPVRSRTTTKAETLTPPVRHLTKREIAKLVYTPPRKTDGSTD